MIQDFEPKDMLLVFSGIWPATFDWFHRACCHTGGLEVFITLLSILGTVGNHHGGRKR